MSTTQECTWPLFQFCQLTFSSQGKNGPAAFLETQIESGIFRLPKRHFIGFYRSIETQYVCYGLRIFIYFFIPRQIFFIVIISILFYAYQFRCITVYATGGWFIIWFQGKLFFFYRLYLRKNERRYDMVVMCSWKVSSTRRISRGRIAVLKSKFGSFDVKKATKMNGHTGSIRPLMSRDDRKGRIHALQSDFIRRGRREERKYNTNFTTSCATLLRRNKFADCEKTM